MTSPTPAPAGGEYQYTQLDAGHKLQVVQQRILNLEAEHYANFLARQTASTDATTDAATKAKLDAQFASNLKVIEDALNTLHTEADTLSASVKASTPVADGDTAQVQQTF